MSRSEFYRYQLWRAELDQTARFSYPTMKERTISGPLMNPAMGRKQIEWKSQGVDLMASNGTPVPQLLAIIDPDSSGPHLGVPHLHTVAELTQWLEQSPDDGVVIKPENGRQGTDVMVGIRASQQGLVGVDGSVLSVGRVWQRVAANQPIKWRIERRVVAHPALMGFRSDIVPSLRVQSVYCNGAVHIHAATLKVPSGNSGIDNLSKGNIGAPVDLKNWTLGAGIRLGSTHRYKVHPESGAPIAGLQLPLRAEVETAVTAAAIALLPLKCIGFDVALSDRGPVIFEGNPRFMADVVQLPQDRGILHGAYLKLLLEVGGEHLLAGRRKSSAWRAFEAAELARA
jgi:hypothetical protein